MKRAYGFTIVELLIVIVVIAILAAISVAAYTSMSDRAYDSTVANDAAMIAKKLEILKIDLGHYPTAVAQFPSDLKIDRGAYATNVNNFMWCLNKTTDQYNLALVSKSGKGYWVTSGQVQERANATGLTAGICSHVGATWANNAESGAIHGYNVGSGVWYQNWITK